MSWGARVGVAAFVLGASLPMFVAASPVAASAVGGTATLETVPVSDTGFCVYDELRYTAGPEANNVTVGGDTQYSPPSDEAYCATLSPDIAVVDSGASMTFGSGCQGAASAGDCSAAMFDRVVISTGDGDDSIRVGPLPAARSSYILAGPGNDAVRTLNGQRDVVWCGAGHDVVIADAMDQIATDCEVVQLHA